MIKKIFASFLAVLFLAAPVWGQGTETSTDNFYSIDDFSGGLKSHFSQYLTPKNAALVAQNVRFNARYGSVAKRPKMLQVSACHAAPVKSLYRYYKSDATKYTIQTSSSYLDYVADSTGTCTQLLSGLSDGKRWTFNTYKDVVIGSNGTDANIKWDGKTQTTANTDGSRTAGDLATELGAAFAEQNTGSDLEASKWYQYKVAFYDGSVYKYSSARSNPILTGSTVRNVTLTDIPIGPAGTTSRIIYRTEGNSTRADVIADTDYKKVAAISDNVTRVFDDTVSDSTLSADAAPTWATVSAGLDVTPPHARFSLIHKDRLFLANDPSGITSGKSTIYWSDTFNPDYFNTATDYELIRPDDGDEITALKSFLGTLTIGKTTTWSKFYTDEASSLNWTPSSPFSFIGCIAPYSASNSQAGIIYLGRHGLYTFNGQGSELISDVVTGEIRDVLETNAVEAAGIYYDNQYLLSYTSEEGGSGSNDTVLILDLVRNDYVKDTKSIDSWGVFDAGTDFGTLYSGSSGNDGIVYSHSGTFNDLVYRYKSQFDLGTMNDVITTGDESDPGLELGWGVSIDSAVFSGSSINSYTPTTATINRKDLSGTWTSPAIQISAQTLDKIYWNEDLGSFGEVTWAIRTASTSGGLSAASWSSEYSSPSGSDISDVTGNVWIQLRATLSTTDISETPTLFLEDSFVMHLTYQQAGSNGESSILSLWKSGFTDFGAGESSKRIREIQVYYEGTAGTLTLQYENDQGASYSFDIDLAKNSSDATNDQYFGNGVEKIFSHIPNVSDQPVGRKWKFSLTESGSTEWSVNSIKVRFDNNSYVTFK